MPANRSSRALAVKTRALLPAFLERLSQLEHQFLITHIHLCELPIRLLQQFIDPSWGGM